MKPQPSSRSCFVCGVENESGLHLHFKEVSPGEVIAEKIIPEQFAGYPGVVHGGVVAAMLDEVAGRALMQGEPTRFMFTAKLSIRYRKPVPVGQPLFLKGHAGKDFGRVAEASGEIYTSDGTLLAEADGVYVNVPDEMISSVDVGVLGWKVYPEEKELS
jgi:uncharacterized protein (TIGR00369 family)